MRILVIFCLISLSMTVNARQYQKQQMCKDGDAHDELFPGDIRFRCKPGPGGKHVKCQYLHQSLKKAFSCPGFGYISGWAVIGLKVIVKCCLEPGLQYHPLDCRNHFNNDVVQGRCYKADKGKVITGFQTFDGGFTYFNRECRYSTSPKFTLYRK